MTTFAVTGATGQLGRITISILLERGIAPESLVAIVRDEAKAADLTAVGVDVRVADYNDPEALTAALQGVDRLLLISSSEVGERAAHHGNVVAAAQEAGVGFIAYTSLLHGADSKLALADEHAATERLLAGSGIAHALLRNGWYIENYLGAIEGALATGEIHGAAADGVFAPATRADYAAAAAAVLAGPGHDGAVYELGGDERITMSQLAAIIADVSGDDVAYVDHAQNEYQALLEQGGLPAPYAAVLADSDAGIVEGQLDTQSGDLARLIGRATTSVRDALIAPIAQAAVAAD